MIDYVILDKSLRIKKRTRKDWSFLFDKNTSLQIHDVCSFIEDKHSLTQAQAHSHSAYTL